jgi:hypothetical protein
LVAGVMTGVAGGGLVAGAVPGVAGGGLLAGVMTGVAGGGLVAGVTTGVAGGGLLAGVMTGVAGGGLVAGVTTGVAGGGLVAAPGGGGGHFPADRPRHASCHWALGDMRGRGRPCNWHRICNQLMQARPLPLPAAEPACSAPPTAPCLGTAALPRCRWRSTTRWTSRRHSRGGSPP